MQEKFYILIDEKRFITTRKTNKINGEQIENNFCIKVDFEIFYNSIKKNHNYLNEDLTTCYKEIELTLEQKNNIRKQEIYKELNNIDIQTMRPIRAIQLGVNTIEDTKKLTELEEQAKLLRIELSKL